MYIIFVLTINYYCIQPPRMVSRVYEFFFETDLTFASRNMIIYIYIYAGVILFQSKVY